jgi:hypothetical protein
MNNYDSCSEVVVSALSPVEQAINRTERRYVDMTPNDGLVERILSAYLDYSRVTDNLGGMDPTSPLCIAMNEAQAKRNAILETAIRDWPRLQKIEDEAITMSEEIQKNWASPFEKTCMERRISELEAEVERLKNA